MNYQRIHDQIIERANSENREKGSDVYYERHHIIPKSLGGSNKKENLVLLTAREHFIVHKLLCEIYPNDNKLFFAYHMMLNKTQSNKHHRNYYISNREYERVRTEYSKLMSTQNSGRVVSDEHKKKISTAMKGRQLSAKHKKKISDAAANRRHSDETKQKISNAHKGMSYGPLSEDHKDKISKAHTGMKRPPRTAEYREKLSKAGKGRVPWNKGIPRSEETKQKIRESHLKRK